MTPSTATTTDNSSVRMVRMKSLEPTLSELSIEELLLVQRMV
jgi:hypothetical protein